MQTQNGINSYSQGDLQRMIRQVSDLYTQTAEATAKELEDASTLSEAGGENFKVGDARLPCPTRQGILLQQTHAATPAYQQQTQPATARFSA